MSRYGQGIAVAVALLTLAAAPARGEDTSRRFEVLRLKNGLVLPYPLDKVFRGYARCRRGRHTHKAIDIGGIGPDWGVGTPIRAIARAKVLHIGLPELDPKRYGVRDLGEGTVRRGGKMLPRSKEVAGYGRVRFFTKGRGRLRTGVLLVTKILNGRLKGYTARYMHMGAIHPAIKRKSVIEAGQEIGLIGGTAVQTDAPHLHLSLHNRAGKAVDLGPLFSMGSTRFKCSGGSRADRAARHRYRKKARDVMTDLMRAKLRIKPVGRWPGTCGTWEHAGIFEGGRVRAHRVALPAIDSKNRVDVELTVGGGKWRPRVRVLTEFEKLLHTGRGARRGAKTRAFKLDDSGRKSLRAALSFGPGRHGHLLLLGAWRRRPPRDAGYTLKITRHCGAQASP